MTGPDKSPRAFKPTGELEAALEKQLLERYGVMIANDELRQVLGFTSMDAFRQALSRKRMPVPVFAVANRRGKYALAKDVAHWLARQRESAVPISNEAAQDDKEV